MDSNKLSPMIITDEEENREYTLEYSRRTVSKVERAGFNINEIESKPMTMVYLMFWGAFLMHHPHMSQEQTDKILDTKFGGITGLAEITNEDGVSMIDYLGKLYAATFKTLGDDEGNEKNPRKMVVKF